MPVESTLRDFVIAISPCGALEPSPQIAIQAWRGGGLGVIDLADGGWRSVQALAQAAARSAAPIGIRVPAGCAATAAEVQRSGAGLTVLAADAPWEVAETAGWSRVLVEVTSQEEARAAAASGAHGLIARGLESAGRVSELSTFVLLQQLLADDTLTLPIWAAGGIGLHTAAACVVGGAAGVVLDSQLGLMPESDLPGDVQRVLRRMDGSETIVASGQRGVRAAGAPLRLAGPRGRDEDATLLPIGQDGQLAAPFAARWRDTAAAVRGVRSAILDAVADDVAGHSLAPGGPLAADLGARIPVAQGPMTRVSDQAGFAAAVAADGAMPFIALALADGERSRRMLLDAAAALGELPWGVGVLGFVPEELRAAQLEVVLEIKPTWAIVAGGRPAQAKELEQAGIATFLHVPSPGLLRQFLLSGTRRFVFEGAECGGHIGPRASFPLWEAQIAVIEEFLDSVPPEVGEELQVLFAGGIHDARSAAMVTAMAASLTRRGARIGVLMGTAYLFTHEAVEHGAIMPLFQRMALEAAETALLETSPGHVTRALRTAFVDEFGRQRAELQAAGTQSRDIWMQLEMLNTGRLRLASKGLEHDGTEIDEATQAVEGLYMAGQVAVLRNAPTTVPALHAEVTTGASAFHDLRTGELRELLADPSGEADLAEDPSEPLDVAIVGMASMFAGSTDTDGFWRTILSGKDQFSEVPAERWDPAIYYTPEFAEGKAGRRMMSKWGGFLQPVPFDPIRYGIPPTALGSIDPSQLLALEAANRALNDAGYPYDAPGANHSRTGVVYAAEPGSDDGAALALRAFLPRYLGGDLPPELDEQLPTFTEDTFPGHLSNVVAGRIANRFDLGGTNFTVDAACAASLAALDVACKQLSTGTADMMLCGAVDLHNSIGDFLMFGSVYALSPKGRVATFDSGADGTALGEGVACIAIKRLADAERDGDRIYAVIKGVGAASDGRARSLIAPRVAGQIRTMHRAFRQAGVSPAEVGLVEAHGTGTLLGDQTELDSLTQVFTEAGAQPGSCVLGSVKSQIGHTKSAAGLAGLIKAVLAVYYGVQPPTSNLTKPNKAWDSEHSPFAFLTEPRPWLTPSARRIASLSAFGFGGTNFHVVLSGHSGTPEPRHGMNQWPAELFCFRGSDRDAAHRAVRSLASALTTPRPSGVLLRDLAARAARDADAAAGQVRVAVVARDTAELAVLLQRALAGEHDPAAGLIQPPAAESAEPPTVAFLFPGQGSQRTGALAELFVAFPELRQYLEIGRTWADRMFPPAAFDPAREQEDSDRLRDTRVAQPALGICGLAVSHLLGRVGVRPDMSGGHSYGELVALSAAGAFDPMTLLELSDARAAAILAAAGDDPGTMVAVSGTADQISAVLAGHGLAGDVTLANLNAPGQVVISGSTPAMEQARTALREEGLTARKLPVACAFHSPVVAAASPQFAEALAARQVSAPRLPVWSNRTASTHPADPELLRAEMAAQISSPVRFADQVEAMYAAGARVFVEAGPGQVLTGLVRASLGDRPHLAVNCDGPRGQGLRKFLTALAQLACAGVPVDLSWLFQGRNAAEPAAAGGKERPLWTVNGHLVRDRNGAFLPGANTPARLIKEFPVSSPTNGTPASGAAAAPADRDAMLAEYLRASREMVSAQRDVMLSFLGGQPAGRLVWEQASAPPAADHAVVRSAAVVVTEASPPEARPAPQAAAPAIATPAATVTAVTATTVTAPASGGHPSGPELQDAVLTLISERTGYPIDLIDLDLDLEADLSVDSIKRAEIAGEMATRLGMFSVENAESVLEDLVRARTVRAITNWLEHAVATAEPGPADAPPGAQPAAAPTGEPAAPAAALPASTAPASTAPASTAPASTAPASTAPASTAPASTAPVPTGPELQDAVLTLISERTGYPIDLIDLDLDLEADLSVDSIKRAEIAGEMATRLGMFSVENAESVLEDLVRARTVRAITDWLEHAVAGDSPATVAAGTVPGPAGAVPDSADAPDSAGAALDPAGAALDPAAGQETMAGATPLRILPRLASLDGVGPPSGSLGGARFVITGETPVAKQLAGRLRELGAAAVTGAIDAIAADEVRGADGLILLDGLADAPSAMPPVLFPLIKASLTSDDATATGQHWILAAGEVGSAETAGLAGLFRAISLEYPERFARYVALDRVAPADEIAGRLLGELLAGTREPAVTYADDIRYQLELVPAEVSARASDARASDARASDGSASNGSASNGSASSGAGPEGTGSAEALAMGLTRDSVVVLIGGARGITARIGRELAAASGCRIELVGRTQAPGEPLSADVEAAPDAVALRAALARQGMRSPAEIGRASRDILARREIRATLTELRELGSQVRYHCADAQDEEAIHQILKLVHEEHGRIDGLVYGAGIIEDRLIADKDPESFARVFHTKVSGAQVLLGAVEELQCAPGFVVLFGSIAATFGSRGQSDYAAANDALEAIGTAWGARTGHRCLTVHWGPWAPAGAHPGMVTPELGREYAKRGMGMIDPRQGARSLLRELAWGDPGVTAVIYTGLVADAG